MEGERVLFVGGKTSGLHNFDCDPDENFPAKDFNGSLMVLDLATFTGTKTDFFAVMSECKAGRPPPVA